MNLLTRPCGQRPNRFFRELATLDLNVDLATELLQLFDLEQLSQLHADAEACLAASKSPSTDSAARLQQITEHLVLVRQAEASG